MHVSGSDKLSWRYSHRDALAMGEASWGEARECYNTYMEYMHSFVKTRLKKVRYGPAPTSKCCRKSVDVVCLKEWSSWS